MVEINVKDPNEAYLRSRAVSKKEIPAEIRFSHTRKCYELNQSVNCKNTVDKPLTKSQQIAYNRILEEQREKEEEFVVRRKKNDNKKGTN